MGGLRFMLAMAIAAGLVSASGCSPSGGAPAASAEVLRPIYLTPTARFPSDEGATVDLEAAAITFHYPSPPDLAPAPGQVVAGPGYLRRLLEVVAASETDFRATTTDAAIAELIGDGEVRFRTSYDSSQWIDNASVQSLVSAHSIEIAGQFVHEGGDGAPSCSGSGSATADVTVTPRIEISPSSEVRLDVFDGDVYGEAYVFGTVDVDVAVRVAADGQIACQQDLIEYITQHTSLFAANRSCNILPGFGTAPPYRWCSQDIEVPGTPILFRLTLEPVLRWNFTGTAHGASRTYTVHAHAAFSIGVQRDRGEPSWSAVEDRDGSFDVDVSGDPGAASGTVHAAVTGGVRAGLEFYRVVDLPGALQLTGVFEGDLGVQACGWDVTGAFDLQMQALLELKRLHNISERFSSIPDREFKLATIYTTRGPDGAPSYLDGGTFECNAPDPCRAQNGSCDGCIGLDGCIFCASDGTCIPSSVAFTCADARQTTLECAECADLGGVCNLTTDCCDASTMPTVACVNRQCVDTLRCAPNGDVCSPDRSCCGSASVCVPPTEATTDTTCCDLPGVACTTDATCCGEMACVDGRCAARGLGESCITFWECAFALGCVDGVCAH